eukprot:scaffold250254_cov13-Tisochrysis_lutea.AAC.1
MLRDYIFSIHYTQTEMGAFREHKSRITSLAVAQNDEYLASARCVCVCVASASRLPATCNLLNQM